MLIARSTLLQVTKRLAIVLGVLSCALTSADMVHGPHNGDIHRTYIHLPEFCCFFVFLCLLETLVFRYLRNKAGLNPWLVLVPFAIVSSVASLILFGSLGGTFCGDGGPIASSFLMLSGIAEATAAVGLVGFLVSLIVRKNAGLPILRR